MAVYQSTYFSQTNRIRGQARSYRGCGRAINFAVSDLTQSSVSQLQVGTPRIYLLNDSLS